MRPSEQSEYKTTMQEGFLERPMPSSGVLPAEVEKVAVLVNGTRKMLPLKEIAPSLKSGDVATYKQTGRAVRVVGVNYDGSYDVTESSAAATKIEDVDWQELNFVGECSQ
jgi:hypothetical protein